MSTSRRLQLCAAASLSLAFLASGAAADDARAAAQALFDDAVQAMNDKAYDRACPKLEEVVRLMPGKVGALMQLALCYEESGKIASAWSHYRAAADAAAPGDDRGPAARTKANALAARVPKLTVTVAPENRTTPGFTVTRDGRDIGAAEWDAALPVDPGKHEVVASAPGKPSWRGSVEVTAGARAAIQIPALVDDARVPEARKDGYVGGSAEGVDPTNVAGPPASTGREPSKAIVIGGSVAGVVLGITGGILAGVSQSKASASNALNHPNSMCETEASDGPCMVQYNDLQSQKRTFAGLSMWSFIGAGAVLAGTGVYAIVKSTSKPAGEVRVGLALGADGALGAVTVPW